MPDFPQPFKSRRAVFGAALLLATSGAWAFGSHLRQASTRLAVTPVRLAQAQSKAGNPHYTLTSDAQRPAAHAAPSDPWDEAEQTFDTVYGLVRQYYVDKLPTDRAMTYGAIRSALDSLNDPNCYFLDPDQYARVGAESEGRFGGIGAALWVQSRAKDGYTEHKIAVVSPLPASPAARAGLKTGDLITYIAGKWVLGYDPYLRANRLIARVQARGDDAAEDDTVIKEVRAANQQAKSGMALHDAMQVLRGDPETLARLKLPATSLTLTVSRPGTTAPLTFSVPLETTDVNQTAPIVARVLSDSDATPGATYARIAVFTDDSAARLHRALEQVPAPARQNGLVLDLRGNPGGSLEAAMAVSEMLAPGGMFGREAARGKLQVLRLEAKTPAPSSLTSGPVVVLVDKGTANVAEALAASLVDKGHATLAGQKTFGDALVQVAYGLPDGAAFVLTTAQMQGPKTRWAGIGLTPPVRVASSLPDDIVLRRAVETLRSTPPPAPVPRLAVRPRKAKAQIP